MFGVRREYGRNDDDDDDSFYSIIIIMAMPMAAGNKFAIRLPDNLGECRSTPGEMKDEQTENDETKEMMFETQIPSSQVAKNGYSNHVPHTFHIPFHFGLHSDHSFPYRGGNHPLGKT